MLAALEEVAGPEVRERVRFERDEVIAGIVANWPRGATAARAARLGLARRQELRRHHPPVHRRLPRRARRGADAEGPRPRGTPLMNQIDLAGRVAVVTGGAQGIGYAIAERMLASGAAVVAVGRRRRQARRGQGVARPGAGTRLRRAGRADRARATVAAADAQRTVAAHGKIDILVNNAGITGGNGTDLGARARRLAPRDRGQPGRALPGLPRRRAAHGREQVRPDRQHRLGRRQGRQPERVALQRLEGRA